jgi:glycolate dehydrogenase FAD-linked subunit
LIVDHDITRSLSHDEAEWAPVGEPLALIRATSSDQVAATVRICARFGVPVTARGAGTGLSGGANAINGGVIIALDRLNEIRLIDSLERHRSHRTAQAASGRAPDSRRLLQLDRQRR